PFAEARRIIRRIEREKGRDPDKPVLFETGYGPSGLPHIGTFGEVARTQMVRHALHTLTGWKTKLICFSDDMDALRKVPDNVPDQELLAANLGKPLTRVPDPFGTHDSFGAHNNARLRAFLDRFGFDYEFASSTDYYTSGRFDAALLRMLERFDAVMDIMLPTLGEARRRTYAPFLPIHPETGIVMQVPVEEVKLDAGSIVWRDPDSGKLYETPVTGGHCKLQWKPDWAMRWHALGVDYEMAGKDLIDSVKVGERIVRALGGRPPETFIYELFLDENGQKISKSKGNGLTIDEWLRYGTQESLQLFMFNKPKTAKRLYFDVIPQHVDDYYAHLRNYPPQEPDKRLDNPVWHIHKGDPPEVDVPITFALLLNLVSAAHTRDKQVLWGFISRYAEGASPQDHPEVDRLLDYAINYYEDFVRPTCNHRQPDDKERAALADLADRLATLPEDAPAEDIQNVVYAVGKEHEFEPLRAWFKALYEVLLGQSRGPRFGSFVALYGIARTRELIAEALTGKLAATEA
ncbi:MAG TPA: lysine--tRNA ligase, partial [Thermopetrobacter sp.]|nr:lysine--tRNA ligase [Thermopetrobacter sp.]